MRFLEWLKWFFWDRWHGVSVSAFDERRTSQSDAPVVEIGSLRISRGLFYLLAVLALIVLIVLGLRLFGVVVSTEDYMYGYGMGQVYQPVSVCILQEKATGRTFVAIDCLIQQGFAWLWFQIPAVLVAIVAFVLGFVAGRITRNRKEE